MKKKSTKHYGLIQPIAVIIISIFVTILALIYFAFYSVFNTVLPPTYSIFGATVLYAGIFIGLLIYRNRNDGLIPEERLKNSSFYQEEPDLPDIEEISNEESNSVIKTNAPNNNTEPVPDISEDEIPKELYIRVAQEEEYTIADAKRDTVKQNES
jgi:hypothetical protein